MNPLRDFISMMLRDVVHLERNCKNFVGTKCPTLDHYHISVLNRTGAQYSLAVNHAVKHISCSGAEHRPLRHGEAIAVFRARVPSRECGQGFVSFSVSVVFVFLVECDPICVLQKSHPGSPTTVCSLDYALHQTA